MPSDSANPLLLYDGVCGLCSRLVKFSLERDTKRRLRFASLQSDFAAEVLQRHGLDPSDLDTVYFIEGCGRPAERLWSRSDAVVAVLRQIGGSWLVVAILLRIIPRGLRDWAYRIVARNRYRIFGRNDTCLLPDARDRDRFLDL